MSRRGVARRSRDLPRVTASRTQESPGSRARGSPTTAGIEADPWVALVGGEEGFTVMPARGGEALSVPAFEALPRELHRKVDSHLLRAREKLAGLQREIHRLHREAHALVADLHREVTTAVVSPRVSALREDYADEAEVVTYLQEVEKGVLAHGDRSVIPEEANLLGVGLPDDDFFRRYEVNPLVTHTPDTGAPVVHTHNPTLRNVMGHVGGQMRFGVLVTDFTRIVAGATHRANGGYLVLDAAEVLSRPFAWGALERALDTGELLPGDPGAELGLATPESLEPRPVPAKLKVILVGEPRTAAVGSADQRGTGSSPAALGSSMSSSRTSSLSRRLVRPATCRRRSFTSSSIISIRSSSSTVFFFIGCSEAWGPSSNHAGRLDRTPSGKRRGGVSGRRLRISGRRLVREPGPSRCIVSGTD